MPFPSGLGKRMSFRFCTTYMRSSARLCGRAHAVFVIFNGFEEYFSSPFSLLSCLCWWYSNIYFFQTQSEQCSQRYPQGRRQRGGGGGWGGCTPTSQGGGMACTIIPPGFLGMIFAYWISHNDDNNSNNNNDNNYNINNNNDDDNNNPHHYCNCVYCY